MRDPRAVLLSLDLADPPEAWAALGFSVRGHTVSLGGALLNLDRPGAGISSWTLGGIEPVAEIDGLPTTTRPVPTQAPPADEHPNAAIGIDHVVVLSPDFDRTAAELDRAGLPLRRIRQVGDSRQGFRRLGPVILELVEAPTPAGGPARFWGLTIIVDDLDALARRLGELLGRTRPAVQPGRRIATLRPAAGLLQAVAFMTPPPAEADAGVKPG